ncbi:MAG: DUF3623 family protein [Alphaproteobacteria bacterium]|nr:DUF3623 family protein [Alphaproteobacteria bacterium]
MLEFLPAAMLPILFTVFVWWFGTGVVYLLNQLRPETFGWSMMGASAVLGGAFLGLLLTVRDTGPGGPYHGFLCAVLIWAWAEMGFLTGRVMGLSVQPLPQGTVGWPRLRAAVAAILHHEIALLVLGAGVGVLNLGEAMMPAHLSHLRSFFRQRRMNAFFPFSLALCVALSWWLIDAARAPGASAFEVAEKSMLATLAVLAVIEHLFLVLPIRSEALWTWSRKTTMTAPMEAP